MSGLLSSSRSVIGVNMLRVAKDRPGALNRALASVRAGVLDGTLKPPVGGVYPMDDLAEAHAFLGLRRSIGQGVIAV